MNYIQIAIDGPAASGKSTIAKKIAKKINYTYIDTGAMYRAITLYALRHKIDIEQEENFSFVTDLEFAFLDGHLLMNQEDVSQDIRTHKVSNNVSLVSSYLSVRQACVAVQQEIAKQDNVIMDGRDIGTIVLPQANYKFFLTASIETRAQRRYKDNIERGIKSDLDILRQKIKERDLFDSTRKHSPLKPAEDAVIIDTSDLTIDEVVEVIINKLEEVDKNGI